MATPLDRDRWATGAPCRPYRYVWASELDLMAQDHRLRDRWAGWDRALFTTATHRQAAVFEKLP